MTIRILRKGISFGARPAWAPVPDPPLASCVTLVKKSLGLSFLSFKGGIIVIFSSDIDVKPE